MKALINDFLKYQHHFYEFQKYHHRTNCVKVTCIIVTEVFYYYYDCAYYSSRRIKIKPASYTFEYPSLWILKISQCIEMGFLNVEVDCFIINDIWELLVFSDF